MLSTPLRQHILDYDPPCGFFIPPFAMYDGSSDPYDHMLHYNQAMILNVGDDRLLCKAFPTSLKGPVRLVLNHSANCGSCSSLNTCALSDKKGTSTPTSPSSNGKTSPSGTSHAGLDKRSNRLMSIVWMRSCKTSEEALDRPPRSSNLYPWTCRQLWKNCTEGRINSLRWKITSGPPRKPS